MLWPPPLTDERQPVLARRANAATTSAVPRQRAISAGRRSIIAFHSERDSS